MSVINERIKELRNQFHLSQDYVARYLAVNRDTFTQMEDGKIQISAEDLAKLSTLFGFSAESLAGDTKISKPAAVFDGCFENLDEKDQAEIMNLIRFKDQIKANRSK